MANYSEYEAEQRGRRAGGWIGWFATIIVIAVVGAVGSAGTDYIIEVPGPVYDTLGAAELDGESTPLVDIPGETTFPTTGSLNMLTVSTIGNRDSRVSWFRVAQAWFDKTQALVPIDDIYPEGITNDQQEAISAAQMTESQQSAVAAALTVLGTPFTTSVRIVATTAKGPSVDLLEAGDVVTSINGTPVVDIDAVRDALDANGTTDAATVTVQRAGVSTDVSITPVASDNGPVIGVEITTEYDFPFDVSVQLTDVGGPSAGQIFALAIIDKLTPGQLTGGKDFAGTGTIAADGTIGPIGGIQQKLYGAERAGATYFLAPASNCTEVVGHVPDGMQVFAVSTLSDSLAVLNTVASGASTAFLPRCQP